MNMYLIDWFGHLFSGVRRVFTGADTRTDIESWSILNIDNLKDRMVLPAGPLGEDDPVPFDALGIKFYEFVEVGGQPSQSDLQLVQEAMAKKVRRILNRIYYRRLKYQLETKHEIAEDRFNQVMENPTSTANEMAHAWAQLKHIDKRWQEAINNYLNGG